MNTVTLDEHDWRVVIDALDHTVTILDQIDPKLLGPEMTYKDAYRFITVLMDITNQLAAE